MPKAVGVDRCGCLCFSLAMPRLRFFGRMMLGLQRQKLAQSRQQASYAPSLHGGSEWQSRGLRRPWLRSDHCIGRSKRRCWSKRKGSDSIGETAQEIRVNTDCPSAASLSPFPSFLPSPIPTAPISSSLVSDPLLQQSTSHCDRTQGGYKMLTSTTEWSSADSGRVSECMAVLFSRSYGSSSKDDGTRYVQTSSRQTTTMRQHNRSDGLSSCRRRVDADGPALPRANGISGALVHSRPLIPSLPISVAFQPLAYSKAIVSISVTFVSDATTYNPLGLPTGCV